MIFPVNNPKITSDYGPRILNGVSEFHNGIDFISLDNNLVYSILMGTCIYDKDDYDELKRWAPDMMNSGGNYVILLHTFNNQSFYARYLHLKENFIKKGESVYEGFLIGCYADVGRSYGAHLHFDTWSMRWENFNPIEILSKMEEK